MYEEIITLIEKNITRLESEFILIGTMASFILGLQFYGIKQIGKLCERVSRLEGKISGVNA